VISDFVRSYQPLGNPLGFGVGDLVVFAIAALLVAIALAWNWLQPSARRLAEMRIWCFALAAVLPVVLRLALLRFHPAPTPDTADDFAYLLLGDTLAHLRLANPVHPMHRFFEAIFTLQEPSYSSSFPPGQGIVLAFGRIVFGSPWAGVMLSVAALCASCYWMLRGWTTAGWALAGALLAVMQFGPLSQWMNSYWGGAVTASAGCLVFGALPRLEAGWRKRDAALLGAGVGIHMLTRPFESVLLALCVGLYFVPVMFKHRAALARSIAIAVLAATPAVALTLLHNHAVTGDWTALPYSLSRFQYGVPATFTLQPNPSPHRPLTREQSIDYQAQSIVHGEGTDTARSYFSRLLYRIRFYRFFFLTPLFLVLPAFVLSLGDRRFLWAAAAVATFAAGSNFYPYFQPHYIAALTCVFLLIGVTALERLSRWRMGAEIARAILFLCVAQFLFWYGVHLFGSPRFLDAVTPYETWDFINYGDYQGRIAVNQRLDQEPGKQLVFVRYGPRHLCDEWIHNDADVDRSRVVFAADLASDNESLRRYYPDRTVWLLEPDARPPRLTPYPPPVEESVEEPATRAPAQPVPPHMRNRIDPATIETVR
jgi:hypothetical protein